MHINCVVELKQFYLVLIFELPGGTFDLSCWEDAEPTRYGTHQRRAAHRSGRIRSIDTGKNKNGFFE
jgi:hypothetical protein